MYVRGIDFEVSAKTLCKTSRKKQYNIFSSSYSFDEGHLERSTRTREKRSNKAKGKKGKLYF